MFFLFISIAVHGQEITIYSMPSPLGINWKNPKLLMKSYLDNKLIKSHYGKEKHPIGHMLVELKDSSRHEMAGMVASGNMEMAKDVVQKGYGLGIMFSCISGKLELIDKNWHQVQERLEKADIAFINYKISQPVFDRLWKYLHEYKERGYDKIYNGLNKPREGLGSGCSAFALSFLEVGGLSEVLPGDEWKIHIRVPEELIGGPEKENKKVNFLKILSANHWADSSLQTYRNLDLYDPTIFYNWVAKKYQTIVDTENMYKCNRAKSNGLTINCRNILPPNEPIWLNETMVAK